MASLLIFDLDGTLVDASKDLTLSVNQTRESFDLPALSVEQVIENLGNGARKLIERSFCGTGIETDTALKIYKKNYASNVLHAPRLYDGVLSGMHKLYKAGYTLAVVTNKSESMAKEILRHLGLYSLIHRVIGDGSGFELKPSPDALSFLAKEGDFKQSECWMIGDHYTDLESGRRAGIKRCFCAYGFGNPREETFEMSVEKFEELPENLIKNT